MFLTYGVHYEIFCNTLTTLDIRKHNPISIIHTPMCTTHKNNNKNNNNSIISILNGLGEKNLPCRKIR